MNFEPHLKYEVMKNLPTEELRRSLLEIQKIIQSRIIDALQDFKNENEIKNVGAIDYKFVADRRKRDAYFKECEAIANELNELGHQLLPLDMDSDMDFERTSVSWATDWQDGNARGLDIEFFPSEQNVSWILTPHA